MASIYRHVIACASLLGCLALAQDVRLPESPTDHETMAQNYEGKALQYRVTADEQRKMAEAYASAQPDFRTGVRNPWWVKMQSQCEAMAKDAEKLAIDAERTAAYHRLRARELQAM